MLAFAGDRVVTSRRQSLPNSYGRVGFGNANGGGRKLSPVILRLAGGHTLYEKS
jgi:hypothetical protein